MAKGDAEKGYSNAFWNTLENLRSGKGIQGTLEYVAIEVLIGQAIRKIIFGLPYNWMDAAETHLYSVPMIGQMNFGQPFAVPDRTGKEPSKAMDNMTDGAKAIPGVLVGYIAHKVRENGIQIPAFANKEVLALMMGKVLSRVLKGFVFSSLPSDAQTALLVVNSLMNRQQEKRAE